MNLIKFILIHFILAIIYYFINPFKSNLFFYLLIYLFLTDIIIYKLLEPFKIKHISLYLKISYLIFYLFYYIIKSFKFNNVLGAEKYILGCFILTIILLKFFYFIYYFIKKNNNYEYRYLLKILIFLFIYISIPELIWHSTYRLYGDEPYYFLLTHSIVNDYDVNLKNNYENKDSRHFYRYYLKKQLSYNDKNIVYSSHYIGLPLFLSLGYKIKGKTGAYIEIWLMSLIFIILLFYFFYCYTNDIKNSFIAVLIIGFSAPLFEMYQTFYAEIHAGVFLLLLYLNYSKWKKIIVTPFLFLIILLLGIKYQPIVFIVLLLSLIEMYKKSIKDFLKLFFYIILAYLFYLIINYYFYQKILPFGTVFIHHSKGNTFSIMNILSHYFGLLFGQRYGLFITAPIYIYSVIGFFMIKIKKESFYFFLIGLLPFIFLQGWPGDSPPVRYFISFMPFLGVYLVFYLQKCKINYLFIFFLFLNIIYSIFYFFFPFLKCKITGFNNFYFLINKYTHINFMALLPNFYKINSVTYILAIFYNIVFIIMIYYTIRKKVKT